jgi:hypothetical protein
MGYLSGEIVHMGPEYTSLIASFEAHQDWICSWEEYYSRPTELATLRKINEEYMAKIIGFEDKDLTRIREIRSPVAVAWRVVGGKRPKTVNFNEIWAREQKCQENNSKEPRICIGTNYLISLVPATAKIGDVVVRFWNCDAAILMRPANRQLGDTSINEEVHPYFTLVGRVDVAEVTDRRANPGFDIRAEEGLLGLPSVGMEENTWISGAVYVDLDFQTLQTITASIST